MHCLGISNMRGGGRTRCLNGGKMEEIKKAVDLAMQEFRNKFGDDALLEDGEEFVTIFNNCILILSLEGSEIGVKFIAGNPFRVDAALSIYGDMG